METEKIKKLLSDYKDGKLSENEIMSKLKTLPFEDLGFAKIDNHRALRNGFPEVVFCQGKTTKQVVEIFKKLSMHNNNVLLTRASTDVYQAVKKISSDIKYNSLAKTIVLKKDNVSDKTNNEREIVVMCAGTADMPVAEEACDTIEAMGQNTKRIFDVGVAGIHRLFSYSNEIQNASCIVVVAGMEGALASVVAGLSNCPVIAVPTSVGYGASFGGVSALLTMLNSCAAGITVVNIDNGFGAGYAACMINRVK